MTRAAVTAIKPQGTVTATPCAVYGSGELLFTVGNGGAGATGLLKELCTDYLKTVAGGRIAWVSNHSRNTQLALLHGYIDLALTYQRDLESLAESETWSITHGPLFHDHFCIVGPSSDPAGIRNGATSPHQALGLIAQKRCLFHSRRDGSATMAKEDELWDIIQLAPCNDEDAKRWFVPSTLGPAEALRKADAAGAYLVTDRSTLLREKALGNIGQSVVFFEPTSPYHMLMNTCSALTRAVETTDDIQRARFAIQAGRFIEYVRSARGQAVIAGYDAGGRLPLFATLDEKFARSRLGGAVRCQETARL